MIPPCGMSNKNGAMHMYRLKLTTTVGKLSTAQLFGLHKNKIAGQFLVICAMHDGEYRKLRRYAVDYEVWGSFTSAANEYTRSITINAVRPCEQHHQQQTAGDKVPNLDIAP